MGRLETALKFKKFLKESGHVANQEHVEFDDTTKKLENCFGFACYNFPAEFLKSLEKDDVKTMETMMRPSIEGSINNMTSFLEQTGLEVKKGLKRELGSNEWHIAVYFNTVFDKNPWDWEIEGDYHFVRHEMVGGSWTHKFGHSEEVRYFETLPDSFVKGPHTYVLREFFTLSNPYAREK